MDLIQSFNHLSVFKHNQIAILQFHNGKKNKITNANFLDLDELKHIIEINQFKGLIFTGEGRHFSHGADKDVLFSKDYATDKFIEEMSEAKKIINYISSLPIITIAAVKGGCFGAGLEIALSCLWIFADKSSVFALPEPSLGLIPGLNGTLRLKDKIGSCKAAQVIFEREFVYIDKAYELGIVDKIFSDDILQETIIYLDKITKELNCIQIEALMKLIRSGCWGNNENTFEEETFMELLKITHESC